MLEEAARRGVKMVDVVVGLEGNAFLVRGRVGVLLGAARQKVLLVA